MNRRAQPAFTIRSRKAVDRLKILTSDGRSQVEVVEEALERMPTPAASAKRDRLKAAVREAVAKYNAEPRRFVNIAEYDAWEYDADGHPRPSSDYDDNGNVKHDRR